MVFAEIVSQFTTLAEVLGTWGYLGAFLINLLGSASIILPLPSIVILIPLASILDPWLLGIAAGLGAGIGELTAYYVGKGGGKLIKKKYENWVRKAEKWIHKRGTFPVIVLFAATPLPTDVVGLLAGIFHYDVKKFLLAAIIGKIIQMTLFVWAVRLSIESIIALFA